MNRFWDNVNLFMFFALLLLCMVSHMVMMHFGRPAEMVQWEEQMTEKVLIALIGYIAGNKNKL